jgi:putative DNA primase/helicase
MDFLQFVRACGILINDYPPVGRWVRLPTADKPKHKNGAVKWMQDHGFAQNHATQTEVAVWREAGDSKHVDQAVIARNAKAAQEQIAAGQKRAAEKAEWILSQCSLDIHPYLKAKGFPEERANVWETDDKRHLLVIPMRVGEKIVGCQLIDEEGGKKFLTGQRTSDAAFVINNRGPAVLCEGYATALSIRLALNAIKSRYTLFVCFSAHNLGRIAKMLPMGLVVADNDASRTGERVAQETGWPYFMPPTVGHDFNDFHRSTSLFKCSQALRSALLST